MRLLLGAWIIWSGLQLAGLAAVDFGGTWVVDLATSDSPLPVMKRLGASWWQQNLAASAKLQATYRQSKDRITIVTRAPFFSRTERLRLDGQPEAKSEATTGPYTERTFWSADGRQLISTSAFRTKDGKNATLRVARRLADDGNTLVISETLDVTGEPPQPVIRRLWRRTPPAG